MKTLIILTLCVCLGISCKKDSAQPVNAGFKPEIDLEITGLRTQNDEDDGINEGAVVKVSEVGRNDHSVYFFGGVAGMYYGCSSSFQLAEKHNLEITFGTNVTTNTSITRSDFEALIHPGARSFGSLGAFSSFPGLDPGNVEISYTDDHGKKWSTTRISEKLTGQSLVVKVEVKQRDGRFHIEGSEKIEIAHGKEGYRVTGRFECQLYEMNGDAKRKIKGRFAGIVSLNE